jgi:hypothetical protein
MDHIIHYLSTGKWRKLDSGRLKLDFYSSKKEKDIQIITYEIRKSHNNSQFLGANGNKGKLLIEFFKDNIPYIEDEIN